MAPVTNGRVLFNSIPQGYPEPGKTTVYDTSAKIDLENAPLNGGFLLKTLVLSIDPYMRGMMRPAEIESYSPAFALGQPLTGYGVGIVLRSELAGVKAGDHLYGFFTHEEYSIRNSLAGLQVIQNEHNLPWSAFVGAAGMPGKTAYMAWKEFARQKKGEVAFVTTGAGAVGSFVVQLAKLDGLKVIASAGSDEKIQFMKEIGADVAFNYKTTNTKEVLQKEGPLDIFWDNVGGETLETALDAAAIGARFIECGMISNYNSEPHHIKNLFRIVERSLSINGFIVLRLESKYNEEFYKTVPAKLASGEIKYAEETTRGLDKVGDVILAVLKGTNKAKAVIVVADD